MSDFCEKIINLDGVYEQDKVPLHLRYCFITREEITNIDQQDIYRLNDAGEFSTDLMKLALKTNYNDIKILGIHVIVITNSQLQKFWEAHYKAFSKVQMDEIKLSRHNVRAEEVDEQQELQRALEEITRRRERM